MKKILGISAFYHDSAACIIIGGKIEAATQEERFTRIKHTPKFPVESVKYCLEETGLSIDELDAVVFYDKPLLKFERLLETYYTFSPRGIFSFLKSIPVWLKEKLFSVKKLLIIYWQFKILIKKIKIIISQYHMSHASAFFHHHINHQRHNYWRSWRGLRFNCNWKSNETNILKEIHFLTLLDCFTVHLPIF